MRVSSKYKPLHLSVFVRSAKRRGSDFYAASTVGGEQLTLVRGYHTNANKNINILVMQWLQRFMSVLPVHTNNSLALWACLFRNVFNPENKKFEEITEF